MKYIRKDKAPDYFNDEVALLKLELENSSKTRREVFDSLKCKSDLHNYILKVEQNNLCGYCEANIKNKSKSHIEHIVPINIDKNLVFDYFNLIVSCNGVCFNNEGKRLTCGHKKDTKGHRPNYDLFLKPTKVKNIRDYFIYTPNGFIGSSSLNKKLSNETLRVLNLNDPNNRLPEERLKSLEEFKKSIQKYIGKNIKNKKNVVKQLLDKENLAFISFLRFKYKVIL